MRTTILAMAIVAGLAGCGDKADTNKLEASNEITSCEVRVDMESGIYIPSFENCTSEDYYWVVNGDIINDEIIFADKYDDVTLVTNDMEINL